MKKTIAAVLIAASLAMGATVPSERPHSRKLWWASVAAVVVASALDAHSSWGKPELNPLLAGSGGQFGTRSLVVKSALTGGSVTALWFILRRHPGFERPAAATNTALAASFVAAAVHNSK
jgi:hypothetical protein